MFDWMRSQILGVVDDVQGNSKSTFPYIFDVSEAEINQIESEVSQLKNASQRVERYCEAISQKAQLVTNIISSNAKAEDSVLDMGVKVNQINNSLVPKRREFKSIDRRFRNAAYAIRSTDNFNLF